MDDRHRERQAGLFDALDDAVETVLVPPCETLFYLTGLSMHKSERPTLLAFTRGGDVGALLPELETGRAHDVLGDDVTFHTYGDAVDPAAAAAKAMADLRADIGLSAPVGFEFRATRLLEYELLADAIDFDDLRDVEDAVTAVRARKDDAELETMRAAAGITDDILREVVDSVEPGMREIDVERDIRRRILESEADGFGVGIVTAGERTALPHTNTSEYEIQPGDPLMIDFGVVHDGYHSDITRTFSVGEPDPEFREIYDTVREAARAGREAVAAGVAYEDADRAARDVIEEAGYGEYFTHRLGHGLGLEGHEPPYLVEGNEATFEVGNTFTVEPGVYVDGFAGVRVEDDVALTAAGVESLTGFPRDLEVL